MERFSLFLKWALANSLEESWSRAFGTVIPSTGFLGVTGLDLILIKSDGLLFLKPVRPFCFLSATKLL